MAVVVERAIGVDEYRHLRAEVGWSSPDDRACVAALAASLFTVVADDGEGRLLGMARAVGDGMYVLIVDVVVNGRNCICCNIAHAPHGAVCPDRTTWSST
jgi:hypothetical protein